MKIDKIKINGFGKIKDKEIELKDGINIIYGENESGKSTILKAMQAILYGISKNKNGKNRSDFDQYKPWKDGEFSGKMKYTLDNGEEFEIFRDFKKKNPIIYQSNEDISNQFKMDKAKGISFFEQQVGIDEDAFCKTATISQQEVKLEKSDINVIVQKISNLVSSGDEQISFKKSMDKLMKLQNERIGTDRTKQKPMNIVDSNIKRLSIEKENLKIYRQNLNSHAMEKEHIQSEIEELIQKKEVLKNNRQVLNQDEMKKIETKFKMKMTIFSAIFLVIMTVLLLVLLTHRLLAIIPVILLVVDIFVALRIYKQEKQKNSDLSIHKIDKEIESIENKMNDLKLKNHILDTEKMDMDEKLAELVRIEEELAEQKHIKEELVSLEMSFQLAKECLNKAYDEIKHNLSPKFEQKLCEIADNITGGKYKNVSVNDENGLYIEVENGSYVPVDCLSIGTMDEMYLSLRLSMLSEISQENLPIMFDETFAYFDNNRLKNVMCYLQDKNYDNQIIIFTCTNREEAVLKELKIEYHQITLEK